MNFVVLRNILLMCIAMMSSGVWADSKAPYVGFSYGNTEYSDDGEIDDAVTDLDSSDSGYAVFGGYKFTRYLALEFAYADLGSYTFENTGPARLGGTREFSALSGAAVGFIPLGNSGITLSGKVGIASVSADTKLDDFGSVAGDIDISPVSNILGVGLSFKPTKSGFAIDAGIDTHLFIVERDYSSDDGYLESVTNLYIGARYSF